jgi:CheY-like chemotaxis protein
LPAPFRLLLVEDNDVYRDALGFVLEQVVDYRLPDLAGPDIAAEIRERAPRGSVVFLIASAGAEEREAARIAGVALVRKDEGVEALVEAVHAAIKESGDAADD